MFKKKHLLNEKKQNTAFKKRKSRMQNKVFITKISLSNRLSQVYISHCFTTI